jgi:hypothetical protein
MVAVPESGRSRPHSSRMVVVLPAPFGPRNPVTLPGRQVKPTSLMPAAPKRLVSPLISIMVITMPAAPAAPLRPTG